MSTEMKLATQAIHDKLTSQIQTAAAQLTIGTGTGALVGGLIGILGPDEEGECRCQVAYRAANRRNPCGPEAAPKQARAGVEAYSGGATAVALSFV
jgi:hypothetical protein